MPGDREEGIEEEERDPANCLPEPKLPGDREEGIKDEEERESNWLPEPRLKEEQVTLKTGGAQVSQNKDIIERIVAEIADEVVEITEGREIIRSCEECGEMVEQRISEDCEECGPGIKPTCYAMIGMDAVALFPSMTGKRTAKIVRERLKRSPIKLQGFNWKKALVYVRINKHLTSYISKKVKRYMPVRKSCQGVEPGMSSKGLENKEGKEDLQWIFPRKNPPMETIKEIASIVAEIAIRILWSNYCYDFGGQTYLQQEGGPIGQRPTMAASRIVMQQFFEDYEKILLKADLEISMLKVYVDDGRQITSLLEKGMRYCETDKEFKWNKIAEEEDKKKELEGEDKNTFMARLCLPALNDINPDLTFTVEVEEDFPHKKLPTLDTNMWLNKDGTVSHSFFEKDMKSQLVIEKDSAMSIRQKICILSNEVTRRLYNLESSLENLEEEVSRIMENFTRQCKNSGWGRREIKEMIISGYTGWQRRLERRKEQCGQEYRGAASSLPLRTRKKLTGREDWYKVTGNDKREREQEDMGLPRKKRRKRGENKVENKKSNNIAVMFVPYTKGGELARRLREVENQLENQTGYRIKIVERTGTRLEDILHRSNPWRGQDCQRTGCLLCRTKVRTEKNQEQDCTQRCIVYATWCITCENKAIEEIDKEDIEDKEKNKRKKEIKLHMYIGESSRSAYERGLEHTRDCTEMKKESHMIKHYFEYHEKEELENMEFGMKILRTPKTAFNRQISESVLIQSNKSKHNILNSRSEYNRCALPRLTAKLGDETYDKIDKIKKEERVAEQNLERKIRNLKVQRSKSRREILGRQDQPASKKRRTGELTYKRTINQEGVQEKRKEQEITEKESEKRDFSIFENMRKKQRTTKEEHKAHETSESRWEEPIDWEKYLMDKEQSIKEEERRLKEEERKSKKAGEELRTPQTMY